MSAVDAIVGVLAVATLASVTTVIAFHWRVVRANPRRAGLLPWHVVCVAGAQLCLLFGLGAAILFLPTSTPGWLAAVLHGTYFTGTILTLAALFIVGAYERHQFRITAAARYAPGTAEQQPS